MKRSSFNEASLFWNEIYNNRMKYGFNTYGVGIINETSIFFNMLPNRAKCKKRYKSDFNENAISRKM